MQTAASLPLRRLQEENPPTGTDASVSPRMPNAFPCTDVLDEFSDQTLTVEKVPQDALVVKNKAD